jgi:hypothetical protein
MKTSANEAKLRRVLPFVATSPEATTAQEGPQAQFTVVRRGKAPGAGGLPRRGQPGWNALAARDGRICSPTRRKPTPALRCASPVRQNLAQPPWGGLPPYTPIGSAPRGFSSPSFDGPFSLSPETPRAPQPLLPSPPQPDLAGSIGGCCPINYLKKRVPEKMRRTTAHALAMRSAQELPAALQPGQQIHGFPDLSLQPTSPRRVLSPRPALAEGSLKKEMREAKSRPRNWPS